MRPRKKLRFIGLLYKGHRYVGLAITGVVIVLAISGILINHTDQLQLDQRFVENNWVLDWYGIQAPADNIAFHTQNHWVTQLEKQLYFDQQALPPTQSPLRGAVENSRVIVIALTHQLLLLTLEGELIEQIDLATEHNEAIKQIGLGSDGTVYLLRGERIERSDDELLTWQPANGEGVHWSTPQTLPAPLRTTLNQAFRARIVPLERFVLDLHSGRLFGAVGVFVVDAATVLLLFLALSGCWIWINHKLRSMRARRSRNQNQ